MSYTMTKGDVQVMPLDTELCDDCDELATHGIQLEIRVAAETFVVGKYCELHATQRAHDMIADLPEDEATKPTQPSLDLPALDLPEDL